MDLEGALSFEDLSATDTARVGFVSEPNGRGTLSLLFSCLFTLALCVWSAIHLNLPRHEESAISYTWRQIRWSLLGVFGPELVVWAAWRQFISARALRNDVIKLMSAGRQPGPSGDYTATPSVRHPWTLAHGFYAGMGGFVIDTTEISGAGEDSMFPGCSRLFLTPRGIRLLAECGLLPDISRAEIQDKSKSDGVEKLICCLQTSWMLFQVGTRLILGLPITMLEINTVAHVFCALVIFIFWWDKPRWVKHPTLLKAEWVPRMCAFMYMSSNVSGLADDNRVFLRDLAVNPEISKLYYQPPSSDCGSDAGQDPTREDYDKGDIVLIDHKFHTIRKGCFLPRPGIDLEKGEDVFGPARDNQSIRARRWTLACEAIAAYPALRERLLQQDPDPAKVEYLEALRVYPEMPRTAARVFRSRAHRVVTQTEALPYEFRKEELVVSQPQNWPGDDLMRGVPGLFMGTLLWFVSMIFGAIHAAGWHGSFPSIAEQWLWRSSSAYIVFSGMVWTVINALAHVSGHVWCLWYDVITGKAHWSCYLILVPLCSACGIMYLAARLYVVVEAFTSLRSLPVAAFQSPSWLLSVPHF